MADLRYSQWRLEMKHLKETGKPFPEDQRHNRPDNAPAGFWRQRNARTKADHPIAIWFDGDRLCVKFGNKAEVATDEEVAEFFAKGFLKCEAVLRDPDPKFPNLESWSEALENGRWKDGKIIRMPTAAEQADIIPTTSAAEGGNADGGELVDQIRATLERGVAKLKNLGAITTLDKANDAAEVIEELRAAYKLGNDARKAEKKPFDDGAKAVQDKWQGMLDTIENAAKSTVAAVQKFRDAEEARLKREERERREAEQKRIREEEEARLRTEAEARAKQAEQMGMEVETVSDADIAAQAAEAAAAQVQQMPEADTKVRVGTATGRGIAKAKIKKGRITDMVKFFDAIKEHQLTIDFMQQRANALARAGANVPGVEFYEE